MVDDVRRATILGLDGATFDVLLPRVENGQMPELAALLEQAAWGGLQSTIPPYSAQAWVSMATGKNQAGHGVVDFWEREPGGTPGQRGGFVSARSVHGETLWQIASRHGRRVGVINVPVTYPPQSVQGYLVSGFLTPPGSTDFAHPPSLVDEIQSWVPDYDPDPFDPLGVSKQQLRELHSWMEKHERVAQQLIDREPADLSFSVVQAIDHLQHLFWNEIVGAPESGEYSADVDRCYRQADKAIGHRRGLDQGRRYLFLVSDHGFGPVRKVFYVNAFLRERGFLSLGEPQVSGLMGVLVRAGLTPKRLRDLIRRLDVLGLRRWVGRMARVNLGRQIDSGLTPPINWAHTRAVSGSPATEGVFVNLRGRDPQGIVEPGEEYESLRSQLVAALEQFRDPDTGESIVRAAYRREEIYQGPFLELLPDVVFDLGDHPVLTSDALVADQVLDHQPQDVLQGRHRPTGILVAAGPGIRPSLRIEGARIVDVAPTVLYAMGLPIPDDMDGRPLLEIFDDSHRADHPVRYARATSPDTETATSGYDEQDELEMERRLRGLGYVS